MLRPTLYPISAAAEMLHDSSVFLMRLHSASRSASTEQLLLAALTSSVSLGANSTTHWSVFTSFLSSARLLGPAATRMTGTGGSAPSALWML